MANGSVDVAIPSSAVGGANLIQKLFNYAGAVIYRGSQFILGAGVPSQSPFNWKSDDSPARNNYPPSYYDEFLAKVTPDKNLNSGFQPLEGSGNYVSTLADLTINDPWDIADGEHYIIFIPGKLTINAKINVDQGGFIAFITKGGITVDDDLGDPPVAAPTGDIEGIYITDGTFDTGAGPNQIVFEGSVLARTTNLQRSLGSSNDSYPAEKFIYRPDFLFTAPQSMMDSMQVWQEVAP